MAPLPKSETPALVSVKPSANWRRSVLSGYAVIFGLLGTFAAWASVARLDGAAIASGVLSNEGSRKTIQHLEGGIVQEILVRDGDRVAANQLLVRLDPTRADTQGNLYGNQYVILLAQEARLLAEFEARDKLVFPQQVTLRANDSAIAPVIDDQTRLFETRRSSFLRNTEIAESLIQQANKELEQVGVDATTARSTLVQIDAELGQLRPLYAKQLVPTTRIAPLERERLRLVGIMSGGEVQKARLKERIDELRLRQKQILQEYRQEASGLLQDVRKQLNEVRQQVLLVSDTQRRSEIRAPTSGTIQQMRFFTVGGVIRAGEQILDIAPDSDELVIKARIDPNDIDRVRVGGKAEIRFPSFGYMSNTVITGTLRAISRDRITDEAAKLIYFAGEVVADKATIPESVQQKLTAGIAAEVLIVTGERTVARYLLEPLARRWNVSLRER
jgi:HlyD family type I secretion membrane fusion protein